MADRIRITQLAVLRRWDDREARVTLDVHYIYRPAGYTAADDPEWIELVKAVEAGTGAAADELDGLSPEEFRAAETLCMRHYRENR